MQLLKDLYRKVHDFVTQDFKVKDESSARVASAVAMGVAFGILPIWGFQMVAAIAVAQILRLNKLVVLASTNISLPPILFVVLYASYWIGMTVMGKEIGLEYSEISMESVQADFLAYIIGSTICAILASGIAFVISYPILLYFRGK